MFRKRQRSNPGSSRSTSPGGSDIEDIEGIEVLNAPIEMDRQRTLSPEIIQINSNEEANPQELNEDPDMNPFIHFRYTNNHPIGSILLKLLNENMRIGEKVGHRSMELSAADLSTQFYNHQMYEKQRLKNKIMQTAAGVEESILTREMNSHTINQSIEAPTNFSAVPTLLSARQRADCFKLLPSGSNKFAGQRGVSILEYLQNLKALQSQMNLSLPEFYEAMLASTTGDAYLLINSWIENEESPATIFHNLLIHYDTRLSPEEARMKLMNYKAQKTSTLGRVEADIMKLANRAASSIPVGPGRAANYNMEVIQGLIRSLPRESARLVQTQNMERSAGLGRTLTAAELSRYLNIYRSSIDDDIRRNGADARNYEKRFNVKMRGDGARKYSAYNITKQAPLYIVPHAPVMVPGSRYPQINQVSQYKKPATVGGNSPFNGKRSEYHNNSQRNWSNRMGTGTPSSNNYTSSNQTYRRSEYKGKRTNANYTTRKFQNKGMRNSNTNDYCSLCGKRDHRATDSCRFMVSDSGVRIPIMPTKNTCTKCPAFVNPRLSHPENLCPYRKTGPWGKP